MKYLWQQFNWPAMTFDRAVVDAAVDAVEGTWAKLKEGLKDLDPEKQISAHLDALATEVTESARIENQIYSYWAVRSSVAKKLGFHVRDDIAGPGRKADALVSVLLNAVQSSTHPLAESRILDWHKTLMEHDRNVLAGKYRDDEMRVISGHLNREIVHFEAPPPEGVRSEMAAFLDWLTNDADHMHPWVAGTLAHLWLVTIHPFDDGNGRLARVIGEHFYAKVEKSPLRFFSYSGELNKSRDEYSSILETTQKSGLDVTPWMKWSLEMLNRSMKASILSGERNRVALDLWSLAYAIGLNERQQKMLIRVIDGFEGHLTTRKWAQIAKCSQDTAERDLNGLANEGLFLRIPSGSRGFHYVFSDRFSALRNSPVEVSPRV